MNSKNKDANIIAELKAAHKEGIANEKYHKVGQGSYLRNMVYGANDGIVTTFAVVAGVAGASLPPKIILILGFANLVADGISMAMGNFLGTRSENQLKHEELKVEHWEIDHVPEEEAKEIERIYKNKGFKGADLKRAVAIITSDRDIWAKEMMIHELGIIPGEEESPWKNGLVTFLSFSIAGLLPLLPYVFNIPIKDTFTTAIVFMAVALFIVGALRTIFTKKNPLLSGLEMLAVGAIAAGSAYGVGYFIGLII